MYVRIKHYTHYIFDYTLITANISKIIFHLPDLNIPEPTNTPSIPNCIMRAASAGVAIPPAAKLTTGSLPVAATCVYVFISRK